MTKTELTVEVLNGLQKTLEKGIIHPLNLVMPVLCDIAASLAIIADKVGDQNV